jgi:WD40 repeat protein
VNGFIVKAINLTNQGIISATTEIDSVNGRIHVMSWHPNSNQLAVGGEKGVTIWNTVTWSLMESIPTSGSMYGLDWSSDGTQLAYGGIGSEGTGGNLTILTIR